MTLQADRVREVMMILRHIINIDKKYKWHNLPLADILPELERDLARAITHNDEKSEMILSFIASAIFYMKGDIDELPHIEVELTLD